MMMMMMPTNKCARVRTDANDALADDGCLMCTAHIIQQDLYTDDCRHIFTVHEKGLKRQNETIQHA